MEQVLQFLKDCSTFYLATIDGDQPRVRPFGAVCEYEGRLYLITSNQKDVFAQLQKNPRVEISGTKGGEWIRLQATLAADSSRAVKEAMLAAYPNLKNMYSPDDGIMEMLCLKDASCTFCSFTAEPKTLTF